jgi:hypothetical protein
LFTSAALQLKEYNIIEKIKRKPGADVFLSTLIPHPQIWLPGITGDGFGRSLSWAHIWQWKLIRFCL